MTRPRSVGEQRSNDGTANRASEIHHPTARTFNRTAGSKGFVLGLLAAVLLALGCVDTFNSVVDPWGTMGTGIFPTAIESDRALKFSLVEKLRQGPDVLILGSSRSRTAEPAYLRRLTGDTGFNAGVTSGNALDATVFTRMLYDRFPSTTRRYLIFVSWGIATGSPNPQLVSDPRAQKYLPPGVGHGKSLIQRIKGYLSLQATKDSLRVVRACLEKACRRPWFAPDGSILPWRLLNEHRASVRLRRHMKSRLAELISSHHPRITKEPCRCRVFEALLSWMNRHGCRPLVVYLPYHPAFERVLAARHRAAHTVDIAYLKSLQDHLDFVLIDLYDIRTFGGDRDGFYDPTHVDVANMRLILKYVATHDRGVL
jgi:hypothetical protein